MHLLVDGDYLLTGLQPKTEDDVRVAMEGVETAIQAQLLSGKTGISITLRAAFFSTALMNFLGDATRQVIITALRRLRYQVTVLENIRGRQGTPVDSALCTKAIILDGLSNGHAGAPSGAATRADEPPARRPLFCFLAANALLVPALEHLTAKENDVVFAVYNGDEVADALLSYVSPSYGPTGGVASLAKGEGVHYCMNAEATVAALDAVLHESKELPLAAQVQLQQLREKAKQQLGRSAGAEAVPAVLSRPVEAKLSMPPLPEASDPSKHIPAMAQLNQLNSQPERPGKHTIRPPDLPPPPLARSYTITPEDLVKDPPVAVPLPAHWSLHFDHKEQRYFYALTDSTGTARSTWQHPLGKSYEDDLEAQLERWVLSKNALPKGQAYSPPPAQQGTPSNPLPAPQSVAVPPRQTLPAGWEERIDPSSGKTYYVNHQTKATSWTRPAAPVEDPLPANWKAVVDPASGRTYYVNVVTNITSWTRPAADVLPAGWEERIDPSTGKTYYVNHQTKATSWARPAAASATPSALPPDWEERVDVASGKPYYVNYRTKVTSWQRPTS